MSRVYGDHRSSHGHKVGLQGFSMTKQGNLSQSLSPSVRSWKKRLSMLLATMDGLSISLGKCGHRDASKEEKRK